MLHLDYETRSPVDLKKAGAYRYARDPDTEILCMAYAFNDDPPQLWRPGTPFPAAVADHFAAGLPIHAHNSAFDRLITEYIVCPELDLPEPPLEAWYCTAAQARNNNLPGALGDLTVALGLPVNQMKDKRGAALIRKMSVPPYEDTPELRAEMEAYCLQDVVAERAVARLSHPLEPEELEVFHVSERVNDRGIRIDRELAAAAAQYAHAEVADIRRLLAEITDGQVTSPRSPKAILAWLRPRLTPGQLGLLAVTRVDRKTEQKVERETIDANARLRLLEDQDLDPDVREVLELLDEAGRSSTAKFARMLEMADPDDDRVRGAYLYAGAAGTGRWSSKGVQVHNLVRATAKDPEAIRAKILAGAPLEDPMTVLGSMLRPAIVAAPGNVLVGGDWSGIEARVLPWLADNPGAHGRLQKIVDGVDLYIEAAERFQGTRQEGKTAELAFGFGGAEGALRTMARKFGLTLSEARATTIKTAWRAANSWAPDFWYALERAALSAMKSPGAIYTAGRLRFQAGEGQLWMQLPSGRIITYQRATVVQRKFRGHVKDSLTALKAGLRPIKGKDWPRFNLWYGLLAENGTQAASADVLRECLVRLDKRVGPWLIGHTHDEILLEVPAGRLEEAQAILREEMLRQPPWAPGLPLDAKFWHGIRYGKD